MIFALTRKKVRKIILRINFTSILPLARICDREHPQASILLQRASSTTKILTFEMKTKTDSKASRTRPSEIILQVKVDQ